MASSSTVLAIVATFSGFHVPSSDNSHNPAPQKREDNDEQPPSQCCPEGGIVTLLGLAYQWGSGQHLLGFFGLDSMTKGKVQLVAVVPFKISYAHRDPSPCK
jgi:hypothetical protein